MGQTILGGALTSIFAGVFLMFCNVAFLNQFGILFITTIVSSFLSSVVFFPSILFIFGPDDETIPVVFGNLLCRIPLTSILDVGECFVQLTL